MAEPTQKRSPAHGPRWAGQAVHAWTITHLDLGAASYKEALCPGRSRLRQI